MRANALARRMRWSGGNKNSHPDPGRELHAHAVPPRLTGPMPDISFRPITGSAGCHTQTRFSGFRSQGVFAAVSGEGFQPVAFTLCRGGRGYSSWSSRIVETYYNEFGGEKQEEVTSSRWSVARSRPRRSRKAAKNSKKMHFNTIQPSSPAAKRSNHGWARMEMRKATRYDWWDRIGRNVGTG